MTDLLSRRFQRFINLPPIPLLITDNTVPARMETAPSHEFSWSDQRPARFVDPTTRGVPYLGRVLNLRYTRIRSIDARQSISRGNSPIILSSYLRETPGIVLLFIALSRGKRRQEARSERQEREREGEREAYRDVRSVSSSPENRDT